MREDSDGLDPPAACVLWVTIPANRLHDELWVYRSVDDDPSRCLAIDSGGGCHVPKADGRRKLGFRWRSIDDGAGMHRLGFRRFGFDERQADRWWQEQQALDEEPFDLHAV